MPANGQTARGPGASTELARDLRLFDVTMVGVGAMVGAGIFALTGIAAGAAGPGLILAFALNGLLTLCTAMVYAEIGSAIPGAGGGYLWTKFGLPGPGAFLAGWMDWLAHAVAGSLYAVVFGTYAVWGMQTILRWGTPPTGAEHGAMGTLFGIDAIWVAKALTLLVCLVFVYINYRGSAETGKAGNIITVSKICTIALFIVFGLSALLRQPEGVTLEDKFSPFLPTGGTGVLVAMGLTFIAFEGYEIIVQAGEEVVDPRRNIPRAVFWSLAIVIPIYLLVAIVCIGAMSVPAALATPAGPFAPDETWRYLAALGETGVAEAANQFMPWGTGAVLLVLGAILSTMSAELNATTFSSTRVSFAMGRDRNLPAFMATISPRTRTPVAALLASGALITFVAVTLDAERVAAATCVMFLLVFASVNLAAITIRRKYGAHLQYGYVMPLFPAIPVIAIIGQLGVAVFLFRHEPLSLYITVGWVLVGLVVYYTYSRHQEHELRATPVIFEQRPVVDETRGRVLVPVANPANAGPLVGLAARLAAARDASLVILHVVAVPEQLPYYATGRFVKEARGVVDAGLAVASGREVPAEGLVRVARHPRSIIDTLVERRCGMLVMGWSGPKLRGPHHGLGLSVRRPLIGSQIDFVLMHTDADTIVVRGRLPDDPRRIVIPVANPRQGRFAVEVAEAVAGPSTELEIVHVVGRGDDVSGRAEAVMRELFGVEDMQTRTSWRSLPASMRLVRADDVVSAVTDAAADGDVLITGASAETWLKRHAFTHFHYELARRYDGPMLLVKLRTGLAKFASQKTIEFFTSTEPPR